MVKCFSKRGLRHGFRRTNHSCSNSISLGGNKIAEFGAGWVALARALDQWNNPKGIVRRTFHRSGQLATKEEGGALRTDLIDQFSE